MGAHRAVRTRRPSSRTSLALLAAVALVASGVVTVGAGKPALADPPGNPYGVELAVDADPAPTVFETTLVASEALVDIDNGAGPTTKMWTFNGVVPGPEIRVNVGDTVIVNFENQLAEPMGIHWHGIELNNISDGTAITQNGVATGDSYTYRFIVPRPGVYWYHPHHHPTNPTFRGMYGSFIVNEPVVEDTLRAQGVLPSSADTKTLVLSDTTVCKEPGSNDATTHGTDPATPWAGNPDPYPGQQGPHPVKLCETTPLKFHDDGSPGPAFAAGEIPNIQRKDGGPTMEGQTVLANGRNRGARAGTPDAPGALSAGASTLDVAAGQGVRLQMINAAAIRYFRLRLTDADGAVVPLVRVGGEGGLLDEARVEGGPLGPFYKFSPGEILLGPGNRADVVAAIPATASGALTLWTLDVQRTGAGFANIPTVPVMHLTVTGTAPVPYAIDAGAGLRTHPLVNDPVEALGTPTPLVDAGTFAPRPGSDNEAIALTNTGSKLGIDGIQGAHDGGGSDYRAVPYQGSTRYARVGDTLELTVVNGTGAHHPFHLHGFSMQPIDFTKAGEPTVTLGYHEFVDEIDVPAGWTLRFRTRVDDRPLMDGTTMGGVVGRWVFHCHIFFHASIGMISEIVVVADDGNAKPFVNADDPVAGVSAPDPAVMTGTYADPEGAAVTLTASDGVVTDEGGGVWAWEDTTPTAGPVYITASDGTSLAQDSFVVEIPNLPPTITISPGQATATDEGTTFPVLADFSDPNSGGTYTATIDYGDGAGAQPATVALASSAPNDVGTVSGTHEYGDDGSYTVVVEITDGELTATDSFVVDVANVTPVVTPGANGVSVEGGVVSVSATYADAGWLDGHTVTVDFDDGNGPQPLMPSGVENTPPGATGSLTASTAYGDNGEFTVTFSVTDDDGDTGTESLTVTVDNVHPDGTIDESGTVLVNGVPTVFADAGQSVPFTASVDDPGSDDLAARWDWDDGSPPTSSISLVNFPFAEPPDTPSPSVEPRNGIVFSAAHIFAQACLYDVGFAVDDDDDGSDSDAAAVVITGAPQLSRGAGYWQTAYKGTGGSGFTSAQLQCYLDIAGFLSTTFNELRDASTIPTAYDDIFVAGLHGSMREQLDRQLLASWLNFANGGVEYAEMLDTDNDKLRMPDTSFIDVMTKAELVRADPASTRAQLQAQRDILTRVNGRDGG